MKTAIIFCQGVKQVNLTPENEDERLALRMFTTNDNISIAIKKGTFAGPHMAPFGAELAMARGEYLRAFDSDESVMFVMTPKEPRA